MHIVLNMCTTQKSTIQFCCIELPKLKTCTIDKRQRLSIEFFWILKEKKPLILENVTLLRLLFMNINCNDDLLHCSMNAIDIAHILSKSYMFTSFVCVCMKNNLLYFFDSRSIHTINVRFISPHEGTLATEKWDSRKLIGKTINAVTVLFRVRLKQKTPWHSNCLNSLAIHGVRCVQLYI